jgi:hypothetical protein
MAVSAWCQAGCGGLEPRPQSFRFVELQQALCCRSKVRAGFTFDVGALAFPHGPHGEWTGMPKTSGLALMQHCAAPSCFYTSRAPRPSTAASYPLRHSLLTLLDISAPSTARQYSIAVCGWVCVLNCLPVCGLPSPRLRACPRCTCAAAAAAGAATAAACRGWG